MDILMIGLIGTKTGDYPGNHINIEKILLRNGIGINNKVVKYYSSLFF